MDPDKVIELSALRQTIIDRVTSVFTNRPTWSKMPFVDHDTYMSIEQVINEEFDKHVKLHNTSDDHNIEK